MSADQKQRVTPPTQTENDPPRQKRRFNPGNLDFTDALIFLYVVVFVRQYFWILNNNLLAWVLTVLVSVVICVVHLRTKEEGQETTPAEFWLVVALPLLLIYSLRVAFPDTSFDVLDYRLMNGERALLGAPLRIGDFFPVRFPFNPAPDMLTGIPRRLLGYRLGTIVNYAVMLWIGTILDRLLRPYIKTIWWRSIAVLLVLFTEHALFLINNYMVDLLALPLLLEATRLAIDGGSRSRKVTIRIALFLGASVALKLTNLAFAIPIALVYSYYSIIAKPRSDVIATSLLFVVAFLMPLLPYTWYIYYQTGNPVFPLYNKIFASPFWPTADYAGVRWGPVVDDPRFASMRWWEVVAWPILVPFRLEHVAGDLGRHAGRLSIVFIAALVGLIGFWKNCRIWFISLCVVVGALLWSSISGMPRYALYLELIGGVVIFYFASLLSPDAGRQRSHQFLNRSAQLLLLMVVLAQSVVAGVYAVRFEWGSRPTVFNNYKAFANDAKYILRDYSLPSFMPARELELIQPVGAWIEASALSGGVQVSLKNNIPALCVYMPEYFMTDPSRARFARALDTVGDQQMFALSFIENLQISLDHIQNAGLRVGAMRQIVVPYYSDYRRIHMVQIEILKGSAQPGSQIKITRIDRPLPADNFRAELRWSQLPPTTLRQGLKQTVYLKVRNLSVSTWPALGQDGGNYSLFVGNHWLDDQNNVLINDDGRSNLLHDLNPDEEMEVLLTVTAPPTRGIYTLEIDMLQEGVTWFGLRGSPTLRTIIRVE
jgi:hypothetical protein